jgi:hypothetical protein
MFGRMQGVTTAIVAFIFAGVLWPHVIKNRPQFYAGLIVVCLIILMDGIAHIFFEEGKGGWRPMYAVIGLLQVVGIVTCVLSTGMSMKALSGEVFNTIEVVRRGGEKETIIVPLRGEQPKARGSAGGGATPGRIDLDRDIAAEEAALDAQEGARPTPPAPASPPPRPADTSIPLE